jgi:protein-S-isoprenylcysteine O-methyltransferase Ste14
MGIGILMGDLPLVVVTATIWTYWFIVGAMVVRLRRKTHKLVGVVPEQRVERLMWLVYVPLVAAWCALPYLALTRTHAPLGLPEFARALPAYAALRAVAMLAGLASLALTIKCWLRMGNAWRMDVSVTERTSLITDGLFARIRHPIYAFSILLMGATLVIVPTVPMALAALVHFAIFNLKARNEERHLLATHGDAYRRYVQRTGRFFPRIRGLAP